MLILNEPVALLAAHDKLLTARLLRRSGIPHPRTHHVREGRPLSVPDAPVVVKPRFGSWGRDVHRCDNALELEATLESVRRQAWYERHGALVQDLVPPQGHDLRVLVAGDRVLGAVRRLAPPGEWRTNVALGGVRERVHEVPPQAAALAVAAAGVVGAALVGVDLLPDGRGDWVVAEVNGAVEFSGEHAPERDVFADVATTLVAVATGRLESTATAL